MTGELAQDYLRLAGQKLGPYHVLQIASMGGVALVYRGEHESLHNQVAIKVLTPEAVPESARATLEQLFLREAQILSQLRCEDIVRAHDVGRARCPSDGKERPYMVVDWLHGHTFDQEIATRRERNELPFRLVEVLELLEPIARGLEVAHKSGIIHRDVNPRNFLLEERPDGSVRAKLIDFGFAKAIASTLTVQNVTGTLYAGSPDYSAPEHFDRNRYGELSGRTDLYTLALSLVEALTLKRPLEGTTPAALAFCTANPAERPTPNRRGAHVSDAVETLFAQALAVDQSARPSSVLAWWRELEAAARAPAASLASRASSTTLRAGSIDLSPAPPASPAAPASPVAPRRVRSPSRASLDNAVELDADAVLEDDGEPAAQRASGRAPPSPPPAAFDADAAVTGLRHPRSRARFVGLAVTGLIVGAAALAALASFVPWPLTCPTGRADCNRRALDGCETDLRSSLANCGGCDQRCSAKNASATCQAGRCSVVACTGAGRKDCNGKAADGCEVDVQTDPENCGGCGKVCSSAGAEKVACKSGACSVVCKKGFGDCDGRSSDGCETNLNSSAAHCGRCDRACRGTRCEAGMCAPRVIATVASAEHLTAAAGRLFFWNRTTRQIESLTADGKTAIVADNVNGLVDLAVSPDVLVWSTAQPARVWAMATAGKTRRALTGVLPKASPVVLDATRGVVAWAVRVPSKKTVAPTFPNAVAAAPFDVNLLSRSPQPVDCGGPVTAFAGGSDQVLCCAGGGLITAQSCKNGQCTSHRYRMPCPSSLTLDASWLYFPQGARLIALSRKGGHIHQLAEVRGRVHSLAFDAEYLYFLAGAHQVDVWRVQRPAAGTPASEPELLARRQLDAASLTVDDSGVAWTRRAKGGAAVVELPK